MPRGVQRLVLRPLVADHRGGGLHQGGLAILKFLVANSSFNVILSFVSTGAWPARVCSQPRGLIWICAGWQQGGLEAGVRREVGAVCPSRALGLSG